VQDRQLTPNTSTEDPTIPAPAEEPAGSTGFSGSGPLPVVASPTTDPAGSAVPPTASEQAYGQHHRGLFGKIGHGIVRGAEEVEVGAAEAVGVMELAGLRYPVKTYEADVDGGLLRGSRVNEEEIFTLNKDKGAVGFVNLCKENNDDAHNIAKLMALDSTLNIQQLHLPILDNSAPSIAQMQEFVAFAQANPKTYVHCEAGKGRTGTAVACYRIAVDGWTADQAIAEGKTYGLSLINQINFIRHFAAVTQGAPASKAVPDDETSTPAPEAPATDTKAENAPEPTAI
jgi:atypical dual specificity phosphatase